MLIIVLHKEDAKINFRPKENQLVILADHKMVYPTQ